MAWLKDFSIEDPKGFKRFRTIVGNEKAVYTAISSNTASSIFSVSKEGKEIFRYDLKMKEINSLGLGNNRLHLMGGSDFISVDYQGKNIDEKSIMLDSNEKFIGVSAQCLRSAHYACYFVNYVIKTDYEGKMIWKYTPVKQSVNLKLLASTDFLYLLSVFQNPSYGTMVLKIDTLGNEVWRVKPAIQVKTIVVDKPGNCYVLGALLNGPVCIQKINHDGSTAWIEPVPAVLLENGFVNRDTLFICGTAVNPSEPLQFGRHLCSFGMVDIHTGSTFLTQTFDLFPNSDEVFNEIFVQDDQIYIGGGYNAGPFLLRLMDSRFVGIHENQDAGNIRVFPNPAREELSIELSDGGDENVQIRLYDQLGRLVSAKTSAWADGFETARYTLTAPGAKGIYVLKVNDGNYEYTQKVVFE